eukprot:6464215-Amphidinium_carterae.1
MVAHCPGQDNTGVEYQCTYSVVHRWCYREWQVHLRRIIARRAESHEYFAGKVPDNVIDTWRGSGIKHPVACTEMVPVLIARILWSRALCSRKAIWFIDSSAVLDALIKGHSQTPFLAGAIARFIRQDLVEPSLAWFARVPSSSNPADAPSRGFVPGGGFVLVDCAEAAKPVWSIALGGPRGVCEPCDAPMQKCNLNFGTFPPHKSLTVREKVLPAALQIKALSDAAAR